MQNYEILMTVLIVILVSMNLFTVSLNFKNKKLAQSFEKENSNLINTYQKIAKASHESGEMNKRLGVSLREISDKFGIERDTLKSKIKYLENALSAKRTKEKEVEKVAKVPTPNPNLAPSTEQRKKSTYRKPKPKPSKGSDFDADKSPA